MRLIFLLSFLLLIACNKQNQRGPQTFTCTGPIVTFWDKAQDNKLVFNSNCEGEEISCNQTLSYNFDERYVYIFANENRGSQCFSVSGDRCEYQIIGSLLELRCDRFTKTYKKD